MLNRPLRSCAAIPSTWPGNVRSDGSARTSSFSSCCCIASCFRSASAGSSRVHLRGDVERRLDRAQRSFEREQGPRQDRHRRRHGEAVTSHDVEDHRHRRRVEARRCRVPPTAPSRCLPRAGGSRRCRRCRPVRWVARARTTGSLELEPDRHLLHRLEDHRVEPADGAEVEEPQRALAVHEDVPRVRVAVVQPVAQHLLEERAQQPGGQDLRRDWRGRDRRGVGHGLPVDLLHDEHPARGERLVDDRSGDAILVLQVLQEGGGADRFGRVVELVDE